MFKFAAFFIVFLFATAPHAHAYLDPGTGSYITQIIIAMVVGGGYMFKVYWKQFKSSILNLLGRKQDDAETDKKKG